MRGNAKVLVQEDRKRKTTKYLIYIPVEIAKALKIKKGNRIDFDLGNPFPDRIEEPAAGMNFKKEITLNQEEKEGN